ncbi:MAG: hypothetical protein ACK5IA_17570 [Cyanobacteriota bacterium]|jgi:hypothetical protein
MDQRGKDGVASIGLDTICGEKIDALAEQCLQTVAWLSQPVTASRRTSSVTLPSAVWNRVPSDAHLLKHLLGIRDSDFT